MSLPTPPPVEATGQVKQLAPAADLIAHTKLDGRPISQLTFLEKSLLFAELSRASYFCRTIAGQLAEDIGFPETRFYDREGAQAYLFGNETDAVICCRGTEPHEWNDIRADLNAFMDAAETVGRVHRGFRSEVNELWPRLEQALVSNERVLWFAGHSLGGAMTAICAGRCYLSHIKSSPEAVFTFGSPRVGDGRYINNIKLNYYRWVNNNDIVTRVPPRWMGYRHGGTEIYANRRGRVSGVTGLLRVRDRWWGFWRTILKGRVDHFADHLMGEYLWVIDRALDQERAGLHAPALERLLKKIGCPSVVTQPVVPQPDVPQPDVQQRAPEEPHFVVMREGETDDVAEVVDVSEAVE